MGSPRGFVLAVFSFAHRRGASSPRDDLSHWHETGLSANDVVRSQSRVSQHFWTRRGVCRPTCQPNIAWQCLALTHARSLRSNSGEPSTRERDVAFLENIRRDQVAPRRLLDTF